MFSFISVALLVIVLGYAVKIYRQFRRNLVSAKNSGVPYVIVPFFVVNRLWQTTAPLILPVLRRLPTSWTEPWLPLSTEWAWRRLYGPYADIGAQTFLTVSPERIVLNTAEASVITQITQRRNDFPKALEVYAILNVYGRNVVTTEGQEWRHQRKIASPQFNETNNRLVWKETLSQAQDMINSWFELDKDRSITIRTVAEDAMRLSLHVISRAGFGVSLVWPGAKDVDQNEASKLKEGHTMSYTDALSDLLEYIIPVIVIPKPLLKLLPFKSTKIAFKAYNEWEKYMWEMFNQKKKLVLRGKEGKTSDLMTALLKGAGVRAQGKSVNDKPSQQTLTDQEIIGNAFVFILAGHETTANSIHFCLAYLAMNVAAQRRLQKDLDETFQGRPVSEWDYDRFISQLFGNMAGAVMNEELRLVPPVTGIPKCTEPGKPQPLIVGGKQCMVPGNTYIALMCHAAHRNPNSWPTGPPADPNNPYHPYSNRDNDLEEFKPERWFKTNEDQKEAKMATTEVKETDDLNINAAPDTAPSLFRPEKGSYIPFSDGYRSCIGRRFAQVELLAFLALVFSQYSIELSVEEWASDEQVEKMDEIGKREVWEKAKAKIESQMRNDMFPIITLQLRKGHFALRLVRRGKEVFAWK